MRPEDVVPRLGALGFDKRRSTVLAEHFLEAERRGKRGHGFSQVEWLATQDVDPEAEPARLVVDEGYERWNRKRRGRLPDAGRGLRRPDRFTAGASAGRRRLALLSHRDARSLHAPLAEAGLVAALTATSPARLGHPEGGPPLAGTNPLSIAIPSSDGEPVVADVSMGAVTYGDVIAGLAAPDQLVPFGEQAHKAFALAVGLQLLVDALAGEGYGAVLLVAAPRQTRFRSCADAPPPSGSPAIRSPN